MSRSSSRAAGSVSTGQAHVIVIGGGFAGLAAAKTLQEQSDVKVTLLEASSTVGGRAKSIKLPTGQTVELGATWLHGTEGHPVFELAKQHGLMSPADLSGSSSFWKGSRYFRQGEANALEGDEERLVRHGISVYAETVDEAEEKAATAGEHLRSKFQELYGKTEAGSRDAEILRDAWHWRELLQRNIDGSDHTDDSSAEGLAVYEELPGPWGTIPGGYQAVAQVMAEGLEDVRCGWAVEEVHWGGKDVRVQCRDQPALTADAVIVTISLGVLKERHSSCFRPPLPEKKAKAIQLLGMGVVDKLFIIFSPDAADLQKTQAASCYNLLWEADASCLSPGSKSECGNTAIEQCLFDAARTEERAFDDSLWHKGLHSIRLGGSEFLRDAPRPSGAAQDDRETNANGGGLVSAVAWIAGHQAVAMEGASDQEIKAGIRSVLDAFPAVDLPRKFEVVRSTWGNDPCTRGSYSYISASSSVSDVDALTEPLIGDGGLPVVLFAGEATSARYIGTTAGAFFSGVREAQRLLDALARSKAGGSILR